MGNAIDLGAVVALLENMPTRNFETRQPILLRRGQIGTVVMAYDGTAYEVEFADRDGHVHAVLSVSTDKLILLHDEPEHIAAWLDLQCSSWEGQPDTESCCSRFHFLVGWPVWIRLPFGVPANIISKILLLRFRAINS